MSQNETSLIDRLLEQKTNRKAEDVVGSVRDWYKSTLGADLPIANIGLGPAHRRMGWEHSRSFDVSLHPTSREGQALIKYLTSQGIPFISSTGASKSASGKTTSTGPHIHVGPGSAQLTPENDPANAPSLVDRLLSAKATAAPLSKADRRGEYMAQANVARNANPLEKLAHDIEWHFGYGVLQAMPELSRDKQIKIAQMATEFAAADEAKKRGGKVSIPESPAWKLRNQQSVGVVEGIDIYARTRPEVDAQQRAKFAAGANPLLKLPKSVRAAVETLALGGAGILEAASGLTDVITTAGGAGPLAAGSSKRSGLSRAMSEKAASVRDMSAEAEEARPLGWKTRLGTDVGAGLVEFAPLMLIPELGLETVMARIGAAALKGGSYTAAQAIGREEGAGDVAKHAVAGGAMFGLQGIPLPGQSLVTKALSNAVIVGGGTTVINRATGAPWDEAATSGLVMTILNSPAILKGLKVREKGVERPATEADIKSLSPEALRFEERRAAATERLTKQRNAELKKSAPLGTIPPTVKLPERPNLGGKEAKVSRIPSQVPVEPTTSVGTEIAAAPRSLIDRLLRRKASTSGAESSNGAPKLDEGVELRHSGLDPRAAIKAADTLERPGFTIDRGAKGERDFHFMDRFRTPLSNIDFKGFLERIGGPVGKQASDLLRRTQVEIQERAFGWEKKIGEVESYLERARGTAPRKEFYKDFIDLVEQPFGSSARRTADPNIQRALDLHDTLTRQWKDYIFESRRSLGIEMPSDWGITDRGYFRHLFLGDIQMFHDNNFIGTARTYAEAQRMAMEIIRKDPAANVHAQARQNFAGDPTVRLTTGKFWHTINELTKSTRQSAQQAARGRVRLTREDILEDVRGTIGLESSKQKPLGALLKRQGYEGASKDYLTVMEVHAGQLARTQELSKLNKELIPVAEQLKAEGKPGLAEEVMAHLDDLWGVPRKSETQIGNLIRQTPILRNHVANPDFAFRSLARKITSLQTFLKLDFNIRASAVNALDPLATLWPYTTTRDFAALYAEYMRPSTRKMLRERGVLQGSTKFAEGATEHGKKTFRQRFDDVFAAEGVRGKAHAVRELPPRPFRAASDLNRGVGYLYGIKDGTRKGLEGDALHRYGLEWAKKVEFDNSVWNVAPLLRSPAGKVIGQFKGYPLKALENVGTMWRKHEGDTPGSMAARQAKFLGSRLVVGGVKAALSPTRILLGIGGYELVVALSDQLQNFGMTKEDADRAAQGVYYGMPALMGQDLSSSVAIIDDLYGKSPEEKLVNLAGGPTVGTGFSLYKAKTPEKAATALSPYARGVGTAKELYDRGEATVPISRGERMPLSNFEAVMRILGFTPVRQSIHFDAPPKAESVKELAERVRQGDKSAIEEAKALKKAGTLSKRDVSKVKDARKLTELQSTFKTYTLKRAEYEYSLLSPEEQASVERILRVKRSNAKKR